MKLHELNTTHKKSRKRVGRGVGSGRGKTAGRGTKGQNARTGGGVRPGFEGGQNPLMKRLPKTRGAGAKARKTTVETVHTDELNTFRAKSTITKSDLQQSGLIRSAKNQVKLLNRNQIEKELNIELDGASKAAVKNVEAAGGKFNTRA